MSNAPFKASKLPTGMPRSLRRKFEEYDEALTRRASGSAGANTLTAGPVGSSGPTAKASAALPVLYQNISTVGSIAYLPLEAPGTLLVARLADGATLTDGGNLVLSGDLVAGPMAETVLLVSDGQVWREVSRSQAGYQLWVPARIWGAIPDTGLDMTAEIQAALTNCPSGATLYFEPGTYVVSSNLKCIIPINIYAYKAVWDWGTSWDSKTTVSFPTLPTTLDSSDTGDAAFTFGYAPASGTTTSINLSVSGLKLTRTASSAAPSAYKGAGFRFLSTYQCHFQDLDVTGFNVGYWCSGSVSGTYERGFAYNRLHNLNASSVAFGIYLDPGMANGSNSGWCNENSFFGGRMALSPTLQANADGCCAVYIRFAATDTHECNNNVFEHLSLEGQSGAGAYWGHKIYCQGRYNAFVWCRYEDPSGRAVPHVVADITFIDAGGGGGTNNVLFYGFDLYKQNIVGDGSNMFNHIYSQTGMDLDRNHTITGRHLLLGNTAAGLYSQSIILGNGDTPGLTLVNTTGAAKNALMVKAANETDNRLALRESTDNSQFVGGMVGYTGSGAGTERNWIGLRNASPYYWGIYKGLRINVQDSTDGDVVWLDGTGTPTEGFKLNATTGRTQVGANAPATTDGKLVAGSLRVQGRLDIGTTSSGSSPVTVVVEDCYIGLTAGTLTVNLPAVANVSDGHLLIIKDESGAGGHTIDGSGAETIDGAATQPLGAYGSMTLVKRNGAWWIC